MTYKVNVIVEKDASGYCAYCPDLQGCQSQGDSVEEVLRNIQEAAQHLETLTPEERDALLRRKPPDLPEA